MNSVDNLICSGIALISSKMTDYASGGLVGGFANAHQADSAL